MASLAEIIKLQSEKLFVQKKEFEADIEELKEQAAANRTGYHCTSREGQP